MIAPPPPPRPPAVGLQPPSLVSYGLVAGGVILGTVALGLPALCPFRGLTGHACPGCGLSRATWSALTGDLDASWTMHPWALPLLIQAVVVAVVWRRRGRRPRWLDAAIALNGVALLATWIVRWRLDLLDVVVAGG